MRRNARTNSCLVGAVLLSVHLAAVCRAVPLSMVMNSPGIVIPNALDEELRDANGDDDFTTHPLERLSSAATCLVAGVEYTHGQQIYRKDPCEFCLCLDGEMFCWWQDCPPTPEGPCRDRGPFTPCQNGAPTATSRPTPDDSALATGVTATSADEPAETASADDAPTDAAASTAASTAGVDGERATEAPLICTVMGRQYRVGDRLPHDTGNCVECVCGRGAQITCSPHQCAPASSDDDVDEINDYRPPGLRAAQPDVF